MNKLILQANAVLAPNTPFLFSLIPADAQGGYHAYLYSCVSIMTQEIVKEEDNMVALLRLLFCSYNTALAILVCFLTSRLI